MKSLVLIGSVILPLAATPALGQAQPNLSFMSLTSEPSPTAVGPSNFSFRVSDIVGEDGSRRKRRSIIAGVEVAPNTTLGLGLFDSLPKAKGKGPDPRLDGLSKRSRRAAVGMSFRF